jgi:NADH-quinone oxidoreductase subunit E
MSAVMTPLRGRRAAARTPGQGSDELNMKHEADVNSRVEAALLGAADEGAGSDVVREIVARHERNPARIIAILQDMQEALGYLPEGELQYVSDEVGLPPNRVYHIATFYKAFRLQPRGRHEIKLCAGTACHVRGEEVIKEAIERELGVGEGETTDDLRFSLEVVRCVGCCGQAPVMMVGEEIHGRLTPTSVVKVLEKYK